MIKVVLLGAGNLAFHLTNQLLQNNMVELAQVYNKTIEPIKYLKNKTIITNDLNNLLEADVYIICISDDAIPEVSSKLFFKNKLVVHTSGSVRLNELKSKSNKGVLYFAQTFSKSSKINFSNIPICIEATQTKDYKLLKTLALSISNNCYQLNSDQRKQLHIAAVFVNNFVNHLYTIGNDICDEHQINFDILKPLIQETASKINRISPFNAQTGPAKRGDTSTINKHLKTLTNKQQEIYTLLTKSIYNTYGNKL